jgi:protein-L-isoaspartate(D-aspartate) O-methyltransferase
LNREESFKETLRNKKKRLLDKLVEIDILKDKRLIKAFMEIPLEKFIPGKFKNMVKLYDDVPNLFYYDEDNPKSYRTISAPHMITIMLQGLALEANDDLLILGAKSGYISALAHHLAPKGEIVILEANSEIAKITADNLKKLNLDDNITIDVRNPLNGMPELAPWQKILVTGAIEQTKIYPLLKQLDKKGGVLFAPIGQDIVQIYTQILRQDDEFYGKQQLQVKFSPLITQLEIAELELITDLDEYEISDEANVKKFEIQTPEMLNKKIEIKYATNILDKISPEKVVKNQEKFGQALKSTLSYLGEVVNYILRLKKEESIDECFSIVDKIEHIFEKLRTYKKTFGINIKKMQQTLNQIRSYIIIRKELEKKDLSDSSIIDRKIEILNKSIDYINILLRVLTKEISRIESVY